MFRRVYLLLLCGAILWCAAIISCPWFVHSGFFKAAAGIYLFFSYLCHQNPLRTFSWWGVSLPVCMRCLAVYLGWLLGLLLHPGLKFCGITLQHLKWGVLVAVILVGLDVGLKWLGLMNNTVYSRSLTGGLLGTCLSLLVIGFIEKGIQHSAKLNP
jgi:uncharacterized membrane protein